MLCDICKKKKATVHLTEIINDDMNELHLCEECAKSKGNTMQQHFGIADLLSGMVEFPQEGAKRVEHVNIKCSNCGMKYADFKKLGRFGCSQCYEAFRRVLYPLFKRIHGCALHVTASEKPQMQHEPAKKTKAPQAYSKPKRPVSDIEELKKQLVDAVRAEEFEKAAVLRDRIKEIEQKSK